MIRKSSTQPLKFSIAVCLSDLTYGQRFGLQRSAKVKDFSVGLKVPANNFRTNLATGKILTPLCFFCRGTPNYAHIDLKMSPSNLTSGQDKFDLRSMSKTLKLCQDVYHSTHFDVTMVFILLCGYSGPIGIFHKPHRCSINKTQRRVKFIEI